MIVPTRRAADGSKVLALPKGHPDGDESPEQAALREVREETGLQCRVVDALGEVRYHYQRGGRRIAKRVAFFLMARESGSLDDHDAEVERAWWMDLAEASTALTYAGEREMAVRALSRSQDAASGTG